MSGHLYEVARREVSTRARTKAFRAVTLFIVLAAVAGPVVAALWPSSDSGTGRDVTIAVVEGSAIDDLDSAIESLSGDRLDAEVIVADSLDTAEDLVADGGADVALLDESTLLWNQRNDIELDAILRGAIQQDHVAKTAQAQGIDPRELARLLTAPEVTERFVDESDTTESVRDGVSFAGLFLAFLVPQVFGQLTLMSVVEEKSTRVIEVLLSHIRPRTLLAGKVLGVSLLAIAQLVLLAAGLLISLIVVQAIDVPPSVWRFVPILLISVIGALGIYNTLFALVGSLISRMEDASQVMMPVMIPLVGGYVVAQTSILGNSDSLIHKVFTFFPLTAPMMLPVRVAQDAIAPWEIVVSLGLLVVSIVVLLRLAGRVYEFALLRTGSRIGWGEVFGRLRGRSVD